LGGLQWMEGSVPTADGDIKVSCSTKQIKVSSNTGTGLLRFASTSKPVCKEGEFTAKGNGVYEVTIQKQKQYTINYSAKK